MADTSKGTVSVYLTHWPVSYNFEPANEDIRPFGGVNTVSALSPAQSAIHTNPIRVSMVRCEHFRVASTLLIATEA